MVKLLVPQLQHLQWIYHKSSFASGGIEVNASRWVSREWPNLEFWYCKGSKTVSSFCTVQNEKEKSSDGTRSCGFSPQAALTNPLVLFCHNNRTAVSTSGPYGTDWSVDKSKTWEFSHQLQQKRDWGAVVLCIYLQWLIFQGVRAASCHWALRSGLQVFYNFPAGEAFVPTSYLFRSFPLSLDKYLMTWCSLLPRPAPQRPPCKFCCPKPMNVMHQ